MLEFLAGENIDTSEVAILDTAPTGIALIAVDSASENSIVVVSGANMVWHTRDLAGLKIESKCSHASWLDALLEEAGVHVTCVDWTDVLGPGQQRAQRSEAGVLLVPLDRAAVDLVWHERGYPAHGDYRDSHRLTGRAHAVWANDGRPYDPERGAARARHDAQDFLARVDDGAVVAFDTELFGHHWHEGITFLEALLDQDAVTPLDLADPSAAPDAPPTSWGLARDLRTWSRGELVWAQRSAELAALGAEPSPRALRELLALQSSDWAFLITNATAGDYPRERADAHRGAFAAALAGGSEDELRNLAPQLANWAFVQP